MHLELVMTKTMEDSLFMTEHQRKSSGRVYTSPHCSNMPKTWSRSATDVTEHVKFLKGIRYRKTLCWKLNYLMWGE